jgi:hypothetical protein
MGRNTNTAVCSISSSSSSSRAPISKKKRRILKLTQTFKTYTHIYTIQENLFYLSYFFFYKIKEDLNREKKNFYVYKKYDDAFKKAKI